MIRMRRLRFVQRHDLQVVLSEVLRVAHWLAQPGATAGGFGGAFRRRDQRMRMEAERRALEGGKRAKQMDFQRAFAVCMEGRGYTVK